MVFPQNSPYKRDPGNNRLPSGLASLATSIQPVIRVLRSLLWFAMVTLRTSCLLSRKRPFALLYHFLLFCMFPIFPRFFTLVLEFFICLSKLFSISDLCLHNRKTQALILHMQALHYINNYICNNYIPISFFWFFQENKKLFETLFNKHVGRKNLYVNYKILFQSFYLRKLFIT